MSGQWYFPSFQNNQNQDVDSVIMSDTHSQVEEKEEYDEAITMTVVGDIMLDRFVRKKIDAAGWEYLFENIQRFLIGADIVVGNLEGTITDTSTRSTKPNDVQFTFDPSVALNLGNEGFTMMSLGNNHTQDFGASGLEATKEYLSEAGIQYFGDYYNDADALSFVQEVRGKNVAWVAYHELTDGDKSGRDRVIEEIVRLQSETDVVMVFCHWGIEYRSQYSESQQTAAHAFVDAGADMVIGAHPHVVQGTEVYKDTAIFYSLGNFIFDQIQPLTNVGIALGVTYTPEEISILLLPIQLRSIQLNLLRGEEKKDVLEYIIEYSPTLDLAQQQQIRLGYLLLP